jgi:hypothetical protein
VIVGRVYLPREVEGEEEGVMLNGFGWVCPISKLCGYWQNVRKVFSGLL